MGAETDARDMSLAGKLNVIADTPYQVDTVYGERRVRAAGGLSRLRVPRAILTGGRGGGGEEAAQTCSASLPGNQVAAAAESSANESLPSLVRTSARGLPSCSRASLSLETHTWKWTSPLSVMNSPRWLCRIRRSSKRVYELRRPHESGCACRSGDSTGGHLVQWSRTQDKTKRHWQGGYVGLKEKQLWRFLHDGAKTLRQLSRAPTG